MSRYAIIIESSNVAGKTDLPGARKDFFKWKAFLQSNLGGAWNESEICEFHKPRRSEIVVELREHAGDYVFLAFSGHGREITHTDGTVSIQVLLNESDKYVDINDIRPHHGGTAIFDSCRWNPDGDVKIAIANESLHMGAACDSMEGVALNSSQFAKKADAYHNGSRGAFLAALPYAVKNMSAVLMLSCGEGEEAEEDKDKGGYYTTLLIEGAKEWASKAQILGPVPYTVFTTLDAHKHACLELKRLNSKQHPDYRPDYQQYPFAVKVR